ncbi:hypothetical protein [Peribacillus sp. FSL R5-0717]|uniref:hypothetical protein n=1 Tax=Peribacillus sp. FSL R5-0717 TaxID=2975308 RepID=UPI0030F82FBC
MVNGCNHHPNGFCSEGEGTNIIAHGAALHTEGSSTIAVETLGTTTYAAYAEGSTTVGKGCGFPRGKDQTHVL